MSVTYSEKLAPAWWVWGSAALIGGGLGLVVSPHGVALGWAVGAAATAALAYLLYRNTPEVAVRGGELRAGRAHVPLGLTGELTALDAPAMRHAHGPGLDARAFLCIRGWIATGVQVALTDPADPTPYWLISSRRPDHLVEAIARARQEGTAPTNR